jgi:hypothetical protein
MSKLLNQKVAFAVLELKDAKDGFLELSDLAGGVGPTQDVFVESLRRIDDAMAVLGQSPPAERGLPVALAARYLNVSAPTVRAWLKRGVLSRVPRAKPVLVDGSSLREIRSALAELRARGQDRDWLRALVDVLHDRVELGRAELRHGIDELEREQLEPA